MSRSPSSISAESPAQWELETPIPKLRAFSYTTRAFAEAISDYETLLRTVAERTTGVLADGCLVSLVSNDGHSLRPASAFCRDDRGTERARAAFVGAPLQDAVADLSVRVVQTGRALISPRVDPRRPCGSKYADAAVELGVHSLLVLLLRARGRTWGTITLVRHGAGSTPFDKGEVAQARALADHAALAISNATMLDKMTRDVREQTERAERETRAFVALVENSTDFIAIVGFDGQVLSVNRAGRALVGLAFDHDVRRLTLFDFHPEDGLARAEALRERGYWQGEGILRHFETGALIPTQESSFIVRAASGEATCFATVQRDLREPRRVAQSHVRALSRLTGDGGQP